MGYGLGVDLKALLAQAVVLDERTFVERNPDPGIVVKKKGKPSHDDQFDSELDWRTRTRKGMYNKPGGPDAPGSKKDPLSKITFAPLVKSNRNPFAGMITVGRTPNNDVCLTFSSVSKLHAYFQQEKGNWFIRDSMSSFGTFVNGERVLPDTAVPVQDGTIIGFGPETECQFLTSRSLHGYLKKLSLDLEKPGS
jgi:hypothetical protein